jgi:protein-tyrosine-phosphatase/DNA-binding HxlR family transcriptional regulator
MNLEYLVDRAAVFAALGDPVRLAVADALVQSDRTPAWLCGTLDVPTNLMAHHVNVLVAAGVVSRSPSEADRRRTYLTLTEVGHSALGRTPIAAQKVLFVCTHNSARSQFAEALWRERSDVPVSSAGTDPARAVHPKAVTVAHRHHLHVETARPAHLEPGMADGALVVSVCDNADEELTPQGIEHFHWSVADPARTGRIADFDDAFATIVGRVDHLAQAVQT